MRAARLDEIKERFRDVDSDILWDIYIADYCFVHEDKFIIDNVVDMFAFILRRTHPEIGHPED